MFVCWHSNATYIDLYETACIVHFLQYQGLSLSRFKSFAYTLSRKLCNFYSMYAICMHIVQYTQYVICTSMHGVRIVSCNRIKFREYTRTAGGNPCSHIFPDKFCKVRLEKYHILRIFPQYKMAVFMTQLSQQD
jgi:hypothetical protein